MTQSEPLGATPWRRRPEELQAGLTAWAEARRGGAATISDFHVPGSGMSNDTILFRLDDEPLVGRLAPAPDAPHPTFPTYDLDLQRRVMELVWARTDVPVPEVVHLEPVTDWLGVPFMVVRAVEGEVPSDNPPYLMDPNGWFLQGTPDDWARFETSSISVLARLHTIPDDDATAFLRPGTPGATALARQLAYQRTYYEWARDDRRVPILERAFDVLGAALPASDRSVLNWGDSRPGNIIYRDFEPVAVLDWEMATVGPPEVDVAWTTFFQQFFAGMAAQYGLPPVPSMFDRATTAATYECLSGDTLDDLTWYEAFAGLRFGIILMRMSLRAIAFDTMQPPEDDDELIMFVPLLERLLGEL
jgi:aminoglycoside phosphotransferase (APT) family kinase protein